VTSRTAWTEESLTGPGGWTAEGWWRWDDDADIPSMTDGVPGCVHSTPECDQCWNTNTRRHYDDEGVPVPVFGASSKSTSGDQEPEPAEPTP
jgi:hypothetical protein